MITNTNDNRSVYYEQMVEVLKQIDVETTVDELQKVFKFEKLETGQYFIRQGEIEDKIAFVCEGYLRYFYINLDGDDYTKIFAFENDFVSSYASLIYQKPTAYSIIAEENCVLLTIDYETYTEQIENYRKWERVARLYTENIYNIKEIREAALLTKSAKERYLELLEMFPCIEKRVKQKHIATFLGIHPVSLSRIRKEFHT